LKTFVFVNNYLRKGAFKTKTQEQIYDANFESDFTETTLKTNKPLVK